MRLNLLICGVSLLACPVFGADNGPAAVRDTVTVDAKTELVIKGALKYLASKQAPNGAFGVSDQEKQHLIAMTAYTLMAFQAAGHLPGEGEYAKNVSLGMQFLLDSVQPDGMIGNRNDGQYMYSHGIASIALAELYGQTKAAAARPKLEKVIKVIISSQNEEGGWRYRPIAREADISVTVLQVVALRAAKDGGLDVPQKTIDNAVKYVRRCAHPNGGFGYQPGGGPGFARTAAAIYSLQVCGVYDDPLVKKGSDYLLKEYKDGQTEFWTYGNFYAAPAQYMVGGETWVKWYGKLQKTLLAKVTTDNGLSSWDPTKTGLDGNGVGPVYSTAVFAMILSMPYHYVPLYQR